MVFLLEVAFASSVEALKAGFPLSWASAELEGDRPPTIGSLLARLSKLHAVWPKEASLTGASVHLLPLLKKEKSPDFILPGHKFVKLESVDELSDSLKDTEGIKGNGDLEALFVGGLVSGARIVVVLPQVATGGPGVAQASGMASLAGTKRPRGDPPRISDFAANLMADLPGFSSWGASPEQLWNHLRKPLPTGLVLTSRTLYQKVCNSIACTLNEDLDTSEFEMKFGSAVQFRSQAVSGEAALYHPAQLCLTDIWGLLQIAAAVPVFSAKFDSADPTGLSTVAKMRPDICIYTRKGNALLLKGELKARDDEFNDAMLDLTKKMTGWNIYLLAGLPFLPCFIWCGSMFQWGIVRGKATGALNETEIIMSPESIILDGEAGYIQLLKESMNMFSVVRALSRTASPGHRFPLFQKVVRGNGNMFIVELAHVVKVCCPAPAADKVYPLLKSGIPGAVRVHRIGVMEDDNTKVKLHISPLCLTDRPNTEAELRSAIQSVLTALAAFHAEGLVHRDIRWENVLKSGPSSWLLADFEEAEVVDEVLDLKLRKDPSIYLPKEVRDHRPYTVKADIWAVGNLMQMWAETRLLPLPPAATQFMDWLLKETPEERPTAQEALASPWFSTPLLL